MELRPIVDSLQPFFPSVYRKEKFDHSTHLSCNFQSRVLRLFSSFFYIAAIFAFLLASPFTKRYGRANTIFAGGIFGLIGAALGMATNLHMSMMIWGRVLLGIGVGFISQSVPLYLLEMVPYYNHDQCNMLYYYYHISCGICASYFSAGGREGSILGCQAIAPAVCTIVYCCRLSDTPSSLVNRGKMDEAKTELRLIHGVKNVDIQFWDILFATKASKKVLDSEWSKLLRKQYRPQLVMSILIPCFQQFTGISAMWFCAPMLFEALGFGSLTSLMLGLSISILNVRAGIFTMNRNRIDNWGRRQLFIAGGIVIFVFQIAVACLIGKQFGIAESGNSGEVVTNFSQGYAISFVLCICILVVAFALSWGPLEWLILTEIFPLEIRSAA
ncbi:hypothetical protein ACH5RR_011704 [Cinchona calisaya]|uniref:Major facilitator superfamily (MFS) profile domain-containing protein n=1 Tax=Cinchona calisaya TaxID=153742 RepID=A0ABD3A785_9GENT